MKKYFNVNSLALGTVQLGTEYGIANKAGKPNLDEARRIIDSAYRKGIRFFDTAQAYGSSEEILGKILPSYADVKVISKFAPNLDYLKRNVLSEAYDQTVYRLGVLPFGMMLHRYDWMKNWDNGLKGIIKEVVISKGVHFGVSVYSLDELEALMDIEEVSLIQIPFNVFSKDMIEKDIFIRAKQVNKNLFLRSTFLQGLLLLEAKDIPQEMSFVKEFIKNLHDFCKEKKVGVKEFCLGYSLFKSEGFGKVLFGAETENQVLENISIVNNLDIDIGIYLDWEKTLSVLSIPGQMLNPSLWPTLSKKG